MERFLGTSCQECISLGKMLELLRMGRAILRPDVVELPLQAFGKEAMGEFPYVECYPDGVHQVRFGILHHPPKGDVPMRVLKPWLCTLVPFVL